MSSDRQSNPSSPAARRLPVIALLGGAAAVLLATAPSLTPMLEFNRAALAAGEVWRILTGHWTHFGRDHLFLDVAAFVLAAFFAERISPTKTLACVIGSAIVISASIYCFEPSLSTYRGLSGIDSALFVLVGVLWIRRTIARNDRMATIVISSLLAALIGKIIYEVFAGTTLFVDQQASNFVVVPLAHAVGGLVGLVCGLTEKAAWPRPNGRLLATRA